MSRRGGLTWLQRCVQAAPPPPDIADILADLVQAQIQSTGTLLSLETRMQTMTDTVTAELDSAVSAIKAAVGDASAAIKDLANKLATASSLNPGDVQNDAASLQSIAAGLEAVVAAAGEPVTPAPVAEEPAQTSGAAPETQPTDASPAA